MLLVPSSRVRSDLAVGPIGCTVTLAEHYHCSLCKMPKGCMSYSHRGDSLKSKFVGRKPTALAGHQRRRRARTESEMLPRITHIQCPLSPMLAVL